MSFSNTYALSVEDQRFEERTQSTLRTFVKVRERNSKSWKEITDVTTVSKNGAGFSLTRPCVVGRLITLVMPLAAEFRAYDHDSEYYPVLGIVQYCNAATVNGQKVYHVGVGFTGKQLPESFKSNPEQNYRIVGMTREGLWEICESDTQFKNRKQPRYWVSIGATISLIKRADAVITKEETHTKNIGSGGMSVATTLDANVGDKVKIAVRDLDFYAIAIVRNRKPDPDDTTTLHLEFVDAQFPVEKIIAAKTLSVATV